MELKLSTDKELSPWSGAVGQKMMSGALLGSQTARSSGIHSLSFTPTSSTATIALNVLVCYTNPNTILMWVNNVGYSQASGYALVPTLVQIKSVGDDRYEFGYNGQMKVDEVAGVGNHNSYTAREYDPRLGIWHSPDKIIKPNLSSYQFGRGNPIVLIDPDGNTEYYFNGKWAGSDGQKNNMIGIVKSKDVRKSMEKGTFTYPTVTNGFNNSEVFAIDANVLTAAKQVLDFSLTDKGKDREYQAGMNPGEGKNGYQMAKGGIVEGPVLRADQKGGTAPHDPAKVNIHSHPTGAELINDQVYSSGANQPSTGDKTNMGTYDMSIIVGKHGNVDATEEKAINGSTYTHLNQDNRGAEINVYDKNNKDNPAVTIPQGDAGKILTDYEKR